MSKGGNTGRLFFQQYLICGGIYSIDTLRANVLHFLQL